MKSTRKESVTRFLTKVMDNDDKNNFKRAYARYLICIGKSPQQKAKSTIDWPSLLL